MRRAPAVAIVLAMAGCGDVDGDATKPAPAPSSAAPAANPRAAPGKPPPPAAAPTDSGIAWTAPAAWKQGQPGSGMRLAQWDVATDAEGDPVQCIVFGGDDRSDDDILARWTLQLGPGARAGAQITHSIQGLVTVTRLSAKGSFTEVMRPGEPKSIKDASLLAAIVEGKGGKVHVWLVGPAAVVDSAAPQFDEFLKSMRAR